MNMDLWGSFEEKYQKNKNFWGSKPSSIIFENLGLLRPGSILDIGAGDGRNAIYLASKGFRVTALDSSPSGLKSLHEKAEAARLDIETVEDDIRTTTLVRKYDNIITNFTLHFLGENYLIPTLQKMADSTQLGGINIVDDFTQSGPLAANDPENYLAKEQLVNFYKGMGWKVLKKQTRNVATKTFESADKQLHHEAVAIIAKKPA